MNILQILYYLNTLGWRKIDRTIKENIGFLKGSFSSSYGILFPLEIYHQLLTILNIFRWFKNSLNSYFALYVPLIIHPGHVLVPQFPSSLSHLAASSISNCCLMCLFLIGSRLVSPILYNLRRLFPVYG